MFYSLLVVAKIFLGEEAAASASFNGGFKGLWKLTRISIRLVLVLEDALNFTLYTEECINIP